MAEVVVVGAGLAGARTCAVLRTAGVTGQVVLLGAEPDPPYDRPPLTKDPDAEVDLRTAMGLNVFGLGSCSMSYDSFGIATLQVNVKGLI